MSAQVPLISAIIFSAVKANGKLLRLYECFFIFSQHKNINFWGKIKAFSHTNAVKVYIWERKKKAQQKHRCGISRWWLTCKEGDCMSFFYVALLRPYYCDSKMGKKREKKFTKKLKWGCLWGKKCRKEEESCYALCKKIFFPFFLFLCFRHPCTCTTFRNAQERREIIFTITS